MESKRLVVTVISLLAGVLALCLVIYAKDVAKFVLCGASDCFVVLPPPPAPPAPMPPPPPLPRALFSERGEDDVLAIGIGSLIAKRMPNGILVRNYFDTDDRGVFTAVPEAEDFRRMSRDGALTTYFTAGDNVYIFKYAGVTSFLPTPYRLVYADVSTFVPGMSEQFPLIAKDKYRVYVDGIAEPAIDANSLTTIADHPSLLIDTRHLYRVSDSKIGYEVTQYTPPITLYSPSNLEYSELNGYVKDKNGVYYKGERVFSADPNTFFVFTNPALLALKDSGIIYAYAKDKNSVYYEGIIVPNADPFTFTPINDKARVIHYYGKDSRAVFEGTTEIPNLDPKTVQILWTPIYEGCGLAPYVKDSRRVFYESTELVGADAPTFESLEAGYGKDKNGIWEGAKFRKDLPKDFVPECNYG